MMSKWWSISQTLSRPATLWCLFGLVVMLAVGGLALLSRHALQLSDAHWASQRREHLEQNVRIALWRLDSRLGPYLATLHDSPHRTSWPDHFVRTNFRIQRDNVGSPDEQLTSYTYVSQTRRTKSTIDNRLDELSRLLPIESVVAAVEELLPLSQVDPHQSLVYGYGQTDDFPNSESQRELQNRNMAVQQQIASNYFQQLPSDSQATASPPESHLGSVWIGDELVIVRSGRSIGTGFDGVWIDWPALRSALLQDVSDLVPGATLHRIQTTDKVNPERTLAALPAMLEPAETGLASPQWSPTHNALLIAWCSLTIASLLAGAALGCLIAMSERRAAFVSAVTHELRTPLTTFRLYSDLLARDMVIDPTDRKEYLETLRREADRLTHLVDNVLRYSKLQRTSKPPALETVELSDWVDRVTPRLSARLAEARMTLQIHQSDEGTWRTDPPAVEQILFNLIDNAAKYAAESADRRVRLDARIEHPMVIFTVTDHGPGVPPALRSTIFRPFAKSAERAAETAAGVGLGLALAKQTAAALGGTLTYEPAAGGGACFCLRLPQV